MKYLLLTILIASSAWANDTGYIFHEQKLKPDPCPGDVACLRSMSVGRIILTITYDGRFILADWVKDDMSGAARSFFNLVNENFNMQCRPLEEKPNG